MLETLRSRLADALAPVERAGVQLPDTGSIQAQLLNRQQDWPKRGTRDILLHYETNPILHMIGSKIGDICAKSGWHVGVVTTRDDGVDRQLRTADFVLRTTVLTELLEEGGVKEITRHPFLSLLDGSGPGAWMLGRQKRKLDQVYLELVGESFSHLGINPYGIPVNWFPLVPTDVVRLPNPDRPFYTVVMGERTEEIPLDQMFFVQDVNPADPYARGIGTGRVVADEITTDEMAGKHVRNYFRNGGTPDILITSPEISPAQRARSARKWQSIFGDFRRSGQRIAMMRSPEGTQIKELKNAFTDGDIVKLRDRQRDFALQVYGISPEIFGILADANRATSQVARVLLAEQVIVPRLEVWREAYQNRLLPRYDERLIVWYDDPTPQDRDQQMKQMRFHPWAFEQAEIRRFAGYKPLAAGQNVRAIPSTYTLTADIDAAAADMDELRANPPQPFGGGGGDNGDPPGQGDDGSSNPP